MMIAAYKLHIVKVLLLLLLLLLEIHFHFLSFCSHSVILSVILPVAVVVVEIFIHGAVKATVTNAPQSQLNK